MFKTFTVSENICGQFLFFTEEKLTDFTVSIGKDFDKNNIDQTTFKDCMPDILNVNDTKFVQCERKVIGQYVKIQLKGKGILSLCEVQVYGILMLGKYSQGFSDHRSLVIEGYASTKKMTMKFFIIIEHNSHCI